MLSPMSGRLVVLSADLSCTMLAAVLHYAQNVQSRRKLISFSVQLMSLLSALLIAQDISIWVVVAQCPSAPTTTCVDT